MQASWESHKHDPRVEVSLEILRIDRLWFQSSVHSKRECFLHHDRWMFNPVPWQRMIRLFKELAAWTSPMSDEKRTCPAFCSLFLSPVIGYFSFWRWRCDVEGILIQNNYFFPVQVRRQSYTELAEFKRRWRRAIMGDRCWVDPYPQKSLWL